MNDTDASRATPSAALPRTPTLLIVEDDVVVRTGIETALKRAGYRAISAANGSEAIKHIQRGGLDLIITDLCMPGMDGVELVIHLRKAVPAVPVIAISGTVAVKSEDLLRAAQLLGASFTIQKPFEASQLVDAVRLLIGPPPIAEKGG
jgi:two-component system cell cycle sensor histidine kinase/response regulator CckA